MATLDEHKLQRILSRFPWRRRKPRVGPQGVPPIGMRTRDGEQLWADAGELAAFEDPGPALLCIALNGDRTGRALARSLVEHHARARGVELPADVPDVTTAGIRLLDQLLGECGLQSDAAIGPHEIRELVTATWAIAAAGPELTPTA
jgi:hypothetical protein